MSDYFSLLASVAKNDAAAVLQNLRDIKNPVTRKTIVQSENNILIRRASQKIGSLHVFRLLQKAGADITANNRECSRLAASAGNTDVAVYLSVLDAGHSQAIEEAKRFRQTATAKALESVKGKVLHPNRIDAVYGKLEWLDLPDESSNEDDEAPIRTAITGSKSATEQAKPRVV